MAINTKLKTDIAFKRLAGNVSITNPSANQFQESIGSSVQLSSDVIFAGKIPSAPGLTVFNTTASADLNPGTVQLVQFDLLPIGASIYEADDPGIGQSSDSDAFDAVENNAITTHSFALHFPSNYVSSQPTLAGNPKAGTGFFQDSFALTGSLGAVQIIPQRFGSDYVPVIKNESGVEISIAASPQDYYLDTFAGVLFRQDGDNTSDNVPKTLEAYVYIGKMVSESVSGDAEGLSETLIAGNQAENDLILTGSLIVSHSAGAIDNVDFSGANGGVTASLLKVNTNADIDGNLNVDGDAVVDGTLQVDGNVTLGNQTTDTVTIAGDLIVQGDVTEINTANLLVEDPYILLNSSSGVPTMKDGGIIVQRGVIGSTPKGTALIYDESSKAWGIKGASGSLDSVGVTHTETGNVIPDVLITTVEVASGTPEAVGLQVPKVGDSDQTRYGQMYVDTGDLDNGGLYIYLPE